MSTLRIHNADPVHVLVVRIWHRSNAFMSDGDWPWLDETGTPNAQRSRDHSVPPGESLEFAVHEEPAVTVLPDVVGEPTGIVDSVRRYFRTGSTDSGGAADGVPFSLANAGTALLRVRIFASATFQFSPLREYSIPPGGAVQFSTGEEGISVRVGEGFARSAKLRRRVSQ